MRSISKFFPRPTSLFLALIGASFFLAACTGDTKPATIKTSEVPTAVEGLSTTSEESSATPVDAPPESVATTSSEAISRIPEVTSTTSPTATTQAYPTRKPASAYADLQVITLLPPDAIPAIDNPQFLSAEEADEFYDPDEIVMGVSFNGESRAYSAPFLSNHEIVNDTVGGVKIAVTW